MIIYTSIFRCKAIVTPSFVKRWKNYSSRHSISWIDKYAPANLIPYLHLARADKQIGTYLLFWPCSWGVALAAPLGTLPDGYLIAKFALGALVMRSAGCTINDLFDRDIDKQVARTKDRPLAAGTLSLRQALVFLSLQLGTGLSILMSFNNATIGLALCSMPIVVLYPLMKRVTYWPQLVLGCCFNWGVLVGWTAVHGLADSTMTPALPLYAAGVCWTLVYDTIYAYQDREDDRKVGVKSTPLLFGDHPQAVLSLIAGGMTSGLCGAGSLVGLTAPFYVGVAGVTGHMLWQIWTADVSDSRNLWLRFSSNRYVGAAVTASIVAGHF